jgi:hypothetical protein
MSAVTGLHIGRVLACFVLGLAAAGCAGGSERAGAGTPAATTAMAGDVGTVERQLAAAERRLTATIGAAGCETAAQCRVVAVGHKACGGPADHLPYSIVDTDVRAVEAVAAEHRALAQRANTLRGAISDCMLVEPPPLACVAGRCTARR